MIETSGGEIFGIKPCPPARVLDPTGAGDAYRAGFLVGCEKGYDLKKCGQMGSAAASFAVEGFGTQAHDFTPEEFWGRYGKTFGGKAALGV